MQKATTQGVAKRSAPATSRGSVPSCSRRSTESSGFIASKADLGSLASSSAPAAPAPAERSSAALALAASSSPATAPAATPTKDPFRQYMKAYLEDRRNPAHAPASAPPPADAQDETSERLLKAINLDLYYGNWQMECYYFCQKCEDHFDTAGAKHHKHVPFAASFLNNRILYCWQQHKVSTKCSRAVSMSWVEFKVFLRKSLGDTNAFVGSVWSRMRGDSQYQLEEV